MIGMIKGFGIDLMSRRQEVTLEVHGDIRDTVDKLKDGPVSFEIKKYRKKRTLTANAYYWSLVNQISKATGNPVAWTHNIYLRDCGNFLLVDGVVPMVAIPDTEEAEEAVLRRSDIHLYPTSHVIGKRRWYKILRGSSDFDSEEMARLIDFAVSDAKAMGISTISDAEFNRLMESYGRKHDAQITEAENA